MRCDWIKRNMCKYRVDRSTDFGKNVQEIKTKKNVGNLRVIFFVRKSWWLLCASCFLSHSKVNQNFVWKNKKFDWILYNREICSFAHNRPEMFTTFTFKKCKYFTSIYRRIFLWSALAALIPFRDCMNPQQYPWQIDLLISQFMPLPAYDADN